MAVMLAGLLLVAAAAQSEPIQTAPSHGLSSEA
jgi:hypothetical protein